MRMDPGSRDMADEAWIRNAVELELRMELWPGNKTERSDL